MAIELGKLGVWRMSAAVDREFAAEVEKLGYGTIWLGGSPGGDLAIVDELLAATERIKVATGIVNIWADAPEDVARAFRRIEDKYPGRFLLGVGAGHREHTQEYKKPYAALVEYLDALDAAGVPKESRALAALGPK
ncbi:LLM class flavin-dependent oxidoreductase, partial [Amycolatopsis sp. NPDC000740]